MKPDRHLLKLVDELREMVASGEVQGLFVVLAYAPDRNDPGLRYDVAYRVNDLDDMLLEVRQQVTRIRSRQGREGARN